MISKKAENTTNTPIFIILRGYFRRLKNNIGGYSSIGRATVCGTVSFLFESGYPP